MIRRNRPFVILALALFTLIFAFRPMPVLAATNDVVFNECMKLLSRSRYALRNEIWLTKPLPPPVEEAVRPSLLGDVIVRWMSHDNKNHSRSYIVLTRDAVPEFQADDPDLFEIIMEQNGKAFVALILSVNAVVFANTSTLHVAGILSCKHDRLADNPYYWNGHAWD